LEARLAARSLSDAQKAAITARVIKFLPQSIQIIPYWQDKESLDIANEIAEALVKAHWTIDNPQRYTALVGVIAGVYISVDKRASNDTKSAAQELKTALNEAGVATTEEEGQNSPPNEPVDQRISMQVGIKP
jgi:hypothetical protein